MKISNLMLIIAAIVGNSLGIQNLPDVKHNDVFDQDLYKTVLNPELCARQLQYIRNEDISLRLQFLESGLRLPRGILQGNFIDFGNYHQCLSINKEAEDIIIQGKHCAIDVPLDFSFLQNNVDYLFDLNEIELNTTYLRILEENEKDKELLLAREGNRISDLVSRTVPDMSLNLMVSVCIPQACTSQEYLGSSILNVTGVIGEIVHERACRLPSDKPFVAADYVAWVVFSFLGLIAIFSTVYDVRHTLILKKDPKQANELYNAFSLYKNSCKIVKLTPRPGAIECLDGVRALSIMWVILGHTFLMGMYFPANTVDIINWYKSISAIWMKSSPLAVDTFFLLSGLLVVYTTASKFTPMKLLKNLHLFYLYRYLRLLPVLAVVILFISSIQHHLGDGPAWTLVASEVQACRSYWWTTLLHLQNFLKPQGGCVTESWYLAIDMQLYLISPIVLFWIFSGSKKSSWIALFSALTISLTGSTVYIFITDFSGPNMHNYYYVNILTRAPPFFVGLIYGYLLHLYRDKKCGLSKNAGYSITMFVLCMTALVLCFSRSHLHLHDDISLTIEKVFMSFEKTAWAICIGWIIFACANGYAGPINWFLSMSVWKIPSRISYSMYLSHMTIIMFTHHAQVLSPLYFTVPSFMFDFMGFLYLTLFVSFFMTALIEMPFATLFRILLMRENKNQSKSVKPKEAEINVTLS